MVINQDTLDSECVDCSDFAAIRRFIAAPINDENKVGQRVVDDPLFDFIESEMMKVGSLSHAQVQWDEVQASILTLFKTKTKDLKLLASLLQCFAARQTVPYCLLSLQVLTDFMEHYWETAYPAPGQRGVLPRKKYFNQIVQRSAHTLDKLISASQPLSATQHDSLSQAKAALVSAIDSYGLQSDESDVLIDKLSRWLSISVVEDASAPTPLREDKKRFSNSTQSASHPPSQGAISKDTLLKVAEDISTIEHGAIHGIRLRRCATWLAITTAPEANRDNETPLKAMSQERVNEYLEQLSLSPSHTLWQQIEQSLKNAPFWFDGQHLSAQVALKLNKPQWADAIADETRLLLSRVPELGQLKFKGGEPFVSEQTHQWLYQDVGVETPTNSDWHEQRKQALALAEQEGLAAAMGLLNNELVMATEFRDQFYWRLLCADVLAHLEFHALAQEHYQSLYKQVAELDVKAWEPSLLQKLENIVITE